jgi:hypothetical protein
MEILRFRSGPFGNAVRAVTLGVELQAVDGLPEASQLPESLTLEKTPLTP